MGSCGFELLIMGTVVSRFQGVSSLTPLHSLRIHSDMAAGWWGGNAAKEQIAEGVLIYSQIPIIRNTSVLTVGHQGHPHLEINPSNHPFKHPVSSHCFLHNP